MDPGRSGLGALLQMVMPPSFATGVKKTTPAPDQTQVPNGTWTIYNPKTGGRKTIRLSTWKEKGWRVVSVLVGPNNQSWGDWLRIGRYDGHFIPFKTGSGEWQTLGDWFARALPLIVKGFPIPGAEVSGMVKCCCCSRDLTVPDSIHAGMGPVCAKKVKGVN